MATDIIATLAGDSAKAVLAHRADLMQATVRNETAVIAPDDPGGLSHEERRMLAARVALLNGDAALAEHYAGATEHASDARWAAILRHVDLVTLHPKDATRADLEALLAAGVAEADIVRLSQLIAFVNFQVRVIAGLRLIGRTA